MKNGSILFLKAVTLLIALGVLALLIRFPQTEGRAANLDLLSIYTDPFIIYLYIASVPFFVGLYQVFKLLGLMNTNKMFSKTAVNAVGKIKYSALALIGFMLGAEAFLFIFESGKSDDMAGGIMMGVLIMFLSLIGATSATVFQSILKKAIAIR